MEYTIGKDIVQQYIPGIITIYYIISVIWGLPNTLQVIGILSVINFVFGLGLSAYKKHNLYDGKIVIGKSENGHKLFSIELDGDPEDLERKQEVSFRIHVME